MRHHESPYTVAQQSLADSYATLDAEAIAHRVIALAGVAERQLYRHMTEGIVDELWPARTDAAEAVNRRAREIAACLWATVDITTDQVDQPALEGLAIAFNEEPGAVQALLAEAAEYSMLPRPTALPET